MKFKSDKQRKAVMSSLNQTKSEKLSDRMKIKQEKKSDNWKDKKILSEQEVNLLKRRLNDGKIKNQEEIFGEDFESKELTQEQSKKGFDYLYNLWKSPTGKERVNNPMRYREQEILNNFDRIELREFHDISKYGQRPYYVPLYQAYSKDGDSMEYYIDSNGISIVG